MNEAFEKIIERLEKERHPEIFGGWETVRIDRAIEIVNQVAEERKNGHYGCNWNGQHEKCKNCGLRGECSHYNTEWFGVNMSENLTSSNVPDINVGENDGWIPVISGNMPETEEPCWITYEDYYGNLHVGQDIYCDYGGWYETQDTAVKAWMYVNAPAPYQPKGEK